MLSQGPYLFGRNAHQSRYLHVGKAKSFGTHQHIRKSRFAKSRTFQLGVHFHYVLYLVQEPPVYPAQVIDLIDAEPRLDPVSNSKQAPVGGRPQLTPDCSYIIADRNILHQLPADSQHPDSLLDDFLERPAYGHDLPDGFHLGAQPGVYVIELPGLPSGDLDNQIVESRFETGRSDLGDLVRQLRQGVSQGQLGRDVRQGVSGRLGSKRG